MSKERELLERAYYVLGELSYAMLKDSGEYNLAGDIYEFLSTPEPTQDEEPIGYVEFIEDAGLNFCTLEPAGDYPYQPIYLHPAPRQEFVRLSEEEVSEILSSAHTPYEAICAAENRLERKNK